MTPTPTIEFKLSAAVTVSEGDSLITVAQRLTQNKVGAVLVVTENGRIVGIVSETDVVQALAAHGADVFSLTAADMMSPGVHTCSPHDTELQIMTAMTQMEVRQLPMVDKGSTLGIVTVLDVLRYRLNKIKRLATEVKRENDHERRLDLITRHLRSHEASTGHSTGAEAYLLRLITAFNDLSLEPDPLDWLSAGILFYVSSLIAAGEHADLRGVLSYGLHYGSSPTIRKKVDDLIAAKLLQKQKSEVSKRVTLTLTPKAKVLLERVEAECAEVSQAYLGPPKP